MRLLMAILGAFLASAGCASARKSRDADGAKPAAEFNAEAVALSALPESAIPKGECGMVLWTLDEERPSPIFRYVAGKQADIVIGGKAVRLTRRELSGATGFGVAERQIFADDNGLRVTVEAQFSLGFDGGSYLQRGVISIDSAGGWKTVVPSAGIAGCRA